MAFPPSLSRLIAKVHTRLPNLVLYSRNIDREMRSDFQKNITSVLVFLLEHLDLRTRNCVHRIDTNLYCTVTISYIAKGSGVSVRTVNRCLSLLSAVGILEVEEQQIKKAFCGYLVFTGAVRKITDKLFALYNLLPALQADRKYKEANRKSIRFKRCGFIYDIFANRRVPIDRFRSPFLHEKPG